MTPDENFIINFEEKDKSISNHLRKRRAYGSQISQTVRHLFDPPLRMDHRHPAPWMQIIFLCFPSPLQ